MPLWFEDLAIGRRETSGDYPVTREEVLAFAGRYDPQGFHLDDAIAAANPLFGRLAASGWHTGAIAMRLTVDLWEKYEARVVGASGLDELAWLKPVYPGDTLRLEIEVIEARPLRSRAGLGMVKFRTLVFNQNGDSVMRQIANVVIERRPEEDDR